ncbi:MAG: hypothetical protein ACLGPL_09845 [Acidobacteriota bacterium]
MNENRLHGGARWLTPLLALAWCFLARPAWATQVHPPSEGIYIHQMGHIFFAFAMAVLIYWLRGRGLVKEAGWRFIQYAAFAFIFWNFDSFIVHILDGRNDIFETINAGSWHARVVMPEGHEFLGMLYYIGKMDHLLSLPAVVLLYMGLRLLLKQARESVPQR